MKKKMTIMIAALAMVLCFAIGGTLAWLVDTSQTVTNTFTYGDINIDLDETTKDYKMIPGNDIAKDPKVTVEKGSEACWLFVEVKKSVNYDSYLENYIIADGWNILNDADQDGISDDGVYYREVAALTAEDATAKEFAVLKDNKVTVKESVTKAMMNAIDGVDDQGNAVQNELDARPTLTFTAYAVQSANLTNADGTEADTAAEAWAIAK